MEAAEVLRPLSDTMLAGRIAAAAGEVLLHLRASGLWSGKALGRAGDRVANTLILEALASARPEDAVLSEESADDLRRLERERVWIVDPLDGTREYSEGRDDWAVHVGVSIDGEAAAGAVAVPALGHVHAAGEPCRLPARHSGLRLLVSRTRPPAEAALVAEALGAELVPMGSAGAKTMAVLRGEADIYLHAGGQYQWDNCAPVAVARAAGLHVSRLDGSPIVYNRAELLLPDLLICRPELAADILSALARRRG